MSRIKRFLSSAADPAAERYAAFVMANSASERARILSPAFRAGAKAGSADEMIGAAFNSDDADSLLHRLLLCDMQLYLPGDLLTLTDRISMLHSLEVRVPFLDHPLIELMAQIPARYKLGLWKKKVLFKRAFRSLLPSSILQRKKLGFSVPLALWLRTDLKPLLCDVLSKDALAAVGYLEHREVDRLVSEHLSGSANHESKLWALINLVLWDQQRRVPRRQACRS
jgi:asparagine synthase (glutamine-hydrolysing)